jgi:hypothetical protein
MGSGLSSIIGRSVGMAQPGDPKPTTGGAPTLKAEFLLNFSV